MASVLGEFLAGLTWPLRGRRVTNALRDRLQHQIETIQFERLREEGYLKGEVAALSRQLSLAQDHIVALQDRLARLEKAPAPPQP